MSGIEVLEAGLMTTVQDQGRPGFAHLGVPRAGALDRPAAQLANRLVGNPADAAVLETLLGGLRVRCTSGTWVAVCGAAAAIDVDGIARGHSRPEWVPPGAVLRIGAAYAGARTYLALAGGVGVEPVLGSRSTDTLAWVGPPRVAAGDHLSLGERLGEPRALETPRPPASGPLRVHPGPRPEHFAPDALERLCATTWSVQGDSDRIGLRLSGPPVARTDRGELASEGMILGAVQVPPDGQPVVFLADHPPTGGYPVVGVVEADDLWQCAQLRPGEPVRFTPASPSSRSS
ncbi:MAG: 5-oxoprolinase/urea amidolyase family protein [Actinobacteria bacterium]|uniref:Unannotated protein n=1 Tax=freshwater metagenome TaxID=449393 RepID=A0A6J6PG69_9ZZZZ|nr:5-oxoprolinase/urea amidolyase family protein [Actinomycetota bacterium]